MSALPDSAWYPDPGDPGQLRWWDGAQWTEHVHPAAQQQLVTQLSALPQQSPQVEQRELPSWNPYASASGADGAAAPLTIRSDANAGRAQVPPRTRRSSPGAGGIGRKILSAIIAAVIGFGVHSAMSGTADVKLDHPFTTPNGALSLSLPSDPKHAPQTQLVQGYSISFDFFSSELGRDRGLVAVGVIDFDDFIGQLPRSSQAAARRRLNSGELLQESARGAAQNTNGTIASSQPTTMGGNPALDVKISRSKPGVAEARIVFVPGEATLYTIIVITRDGDKDLFSRVINSAKLGPSTASTP